MYNRESLISDCLDSVIQQSFTDWECIVVDDGSTDNTLSVVHKLTKGNSRFKIIHRDREPKGANTCRNIGTFVATGDYIMYLDADDILDRNCLEGRLMTIEGSNFDFVIFPTAIFTQNIIDFKGIVGTPGLTCLEYLELFLSGDYQWTIMSPLWKADFIKEIPFNEQLKRYQDIELHIKAIVASKCNFLYPKSIPDNFYRHHTGSGYSIVKMFDSVPLYLQSVKKLFDANKVSGINSSTIFALNARFFKNQIIKKGIWYQKVPLKQAFNLFMRVIGRGHFGVWREVKLVVYIIIYYAGLGRIPGLRGLFQKLLLGEQLK